MGVQMFVCLLVCGGLMEIQTPAPILMKFALVSLFKGGFGPGLTPTPDPSPLGLGGPK